MAGLLAVLTLPGCYKIKKRMGLEICQPEHKLEWLMIDIEMLSRVIQLPARPLNAKWSRGQVGGPADGVNLPGGGDWELVALLEFAEADANKLTDNGRGEVVEVEVPALPWLAEALGLPMPPMPAPEECKSVMLKISGFGYDATPFVQYFLQPVALVKIPETSYFVLWVSTRPPEKESAR